MSDLQGYLPLSQRAMTAKPADLLGDDDVNEILRCIPNQWMREALIRHMAESERSAYCQGRADKCP